MAPSTQSDCPCVLSIKLACDRLHVSSIWFQVCFGLGRLPLPLALILPSVWSELCKKALWTMYKVSGMADVLVRPKEKALALAAWADMEHVVDE